MEAISLHSRWQQSGSQILLMPKTSVFLSLCASSFLPSHHVLARTKSNTNLVGGSSWNNWRCPMGSFTPFWIALPFVEPGLRGDTCRQADHILDCATAGCCHHISALTEQSFWNCTYLCSESLSWQLLGFHGYLSEVFKNDSDAIISSQDWLQTVFPIGNRLAL